MSYLHHRAVGRATPVEGGAAASPLHRQPRVQGVDRPRKQLRDRSTPLDEDRLRLYVDAAEAPGLVAVDVRASIAATAFLASVPSLLDPLAT
ncbi:hypothetical protein [Streptomyces venezuelae]|uniref:hypothetical protein n=1 Tax=Streptomyces venezuelae TaxID=54571 RepID=UPI003421A7DF